MSSKYMVQIDQQIFVRQGLEHSRHPLAGPWYLIKSPTKKTTVAVVASMS